MTMRELTRVIPLHRVTIARKIKEGVIKADKAPNSNFYIMSQSEYDKWFNGITTAKHEYTKEEMKRIAKTARTLAGGR